MKDKILKFKNDETSADQALVIRCNYFANDGEVRAFLEGIGCPYGTYEEIKQRYRKHLEVLNKGTREEQIKFLNTWGFESTLVDCKGGG